MQTGTGKTLADGPRVQQAYKVFCRCCRSVGPGRAATPFVVGAWQEAAIGTPGYSCAPDLEAALEWAQWVATTSWCATRECCGHDGVFVLGVHIPAGVRARLDTDLPVAPEQEARALLIPEVAPMWDVIDTCIPVPGGCTLAHDAVLVRGLLHPTLDH